MESFAGQPGYLKNTFRNRNGFLGFPNPQTVPFGRIISDQFTTISGSYSNIGTATFSSDGTDLNTSGGHSTFADKLTYNYSQCFEEWEIRCSIQLNSVPSGTTFGVGIGVFDQNTPDHSYIGWLDLTNTAGTTGRARIITLPSPVLNTASSGVTVANGNNYDLVFSRRIVNNQTVYTMTGLRLADGVMTKAEYVTTLQLNSTAFSNATGRFAIWSIGGNVKIYNWSVDVFDNKNVDDLIIGDSITHGLFVGDISKRFASLIGGSISVSAGSGDSTTQVALKIQNLIDYNAYRAILCIGTNDVAFGVPATYKTNYIAIVNALLAAGMEVVIVYPIPRNGVDIKGFIDWIKGEKTFKNLVQVDVYTSLNDNGNLRAQYSIDGTHPSAAGNEIMAYQIKSAIGLKNAR